MSGYKTPQIYASAGGEKSIDCESLENRAKRLKETIDYHKAGKDAATYLLAENHPDEHNESMALHQILGRSQFRLERNLREYAVVLAKMESEGKKVKKKKKG